MSILKLLILMFFRKKTAFLNRENRYSHIYENHVFFLFFELIFIVFLQEIISVLKPFKKVLDNEGK